MENSMIDKYFALLDHKAQSDYNDGFDPIEVHAFLYDFQRHLVEWSVKKGRSAIFSDCGTGKTAMQLSWAHNVVRHTNKPVLLLTPIAVGAQTIEEGVKFGIESTRSESVGGANIHVANYERVDRYNPNDFAGIVCDESSALKAFSGMRRKQVTHFMRKIPYRLLCTATAAPNDYTELGTSSEALGELGLHDMLGKFFKNDQNTGSAGTRAYQMAPKWRLKGHAHDPFWRWVCSWARAIRRPSDLGPYNDSRFILPELKQIEHIIKSRTRADGMLFDMPSVGLAEQREESRRTLKERCEEAARIADHKNPVVLWCNLNAEGDMLEGMIKGCVQVSGSDSIEKKEEAFSAFQKKDVRALIIKPKIGAWGLNWQHCNEMVMFPSHSFEQYYQGVRRCWRFGQTKPVTVHIVATEGGIGVLKNIQRKAEQADQMFSRLVEHMGSSLGIRRQNDYTEKMEVPAWL